ncbi:MAG: hypothetical protein ACKVIY_04915, partial [Acidimicrobiales bacterium]
RKIGPNHDPLHPNWAEPLSVPDSLFDEPKILVRSALRSDVTIPGPEGDDVAFQQAEDVFHPSLRRS